MNDPHDELNRDANDAFEAQRAYFEQARATWRTQAEARQRFLRWVLVPTCPLYLGGIVLGLQVGDAGVVALCGTLLLVSIVLGLHHVLAHKIEAAQYRVILELKYGGSAAELARLAALDPESAFAAPPRWGTPFYLGLLALCLVVPAAFIALRGSLGLEWSPLAVGLAAGALALVAIALRALGAHRR